MKDQKEVIADFNRLVNMTADELEDWLKSDDSNSAGWPKKTGDGAKDDGDGETVGHDSGRTIVEILRSNPHKAPDKYTEEQVQHMRKVVAYCKRHLAQETAGNNAKSPEEVRKTKSYASLKNWGHDFLKASGEDEKEKTSGGSKNAQHARNGHDDENGASDEDAEAEDGDEGENGANHEDDAHVGDKRKKRGQDTGPMKKRETRKSQRIAKNGKTHSEEQKEDEDEDENENGNEDDEEEGAAAAETETSGAAGSKKSKNGPSKGETVSWNWGGGHPQGKVLDVKGEDTSITTKNGNEVSRHGKPNDPAVVIDAGKSKAIKAAHELNEY